jgi:PAS domain S-box-containing protein
MGTWEWQIAADRVIWSPGLEALHGLAPGAFAGTFEAFRQDVHPEDRDYVERTIAHTFEHGLDHRIEYRIALADGTVRWVEGSGKLYRDEQGRPERMVGVCADITARKQAEANLVVRARQQQAVASLGELALRERELQTVFDEATSAIARTLEIEYCKVLECLPGGDEVLLRAGVGWQAGLVGSARIETHERSQAGYTLTSGSPVIVTDLRAERRFTGPRLLLEHGVVSGMSCIILGPDGSPWGVLGAHSRRSIEFTDNDVSFLTAVANVLSHAIQRDRAETALRESDRRKDEFIAMLSHELRNPLAPLYNGLSMLRLRSSDSATTDVTAMMERQLRQLVRLVDDLLEASRISRGLLELRRERVQLAAVVKTALEASEPLVHGFGHRLEVNLPTEPLWLDADPVRLAQAITNLLNNAARYTERGGNISVRVQLGPGSQASVSVRDSGAGFSAETKARLFEMFARGAESEGLGVGLALARRLIEMHGGSIEAHSDGVGLGAEFIVTLPLAIGLESSAPEARAAAVGGASQRVLIADDNRDAAESLAMLLRALGNDVTIAYDGLQAVAATHTFRPDVVLLDIGMPGLDGYGAAREIRSGLNGERIKLIALTGWGQDEDAHRAHEAGFDAHLVKPAELDMLRRVLTNTDR